MRALTALFLALLVLPLAACFDAEMNLDFSNEDNVTMRATMNMSPELAQMMAGMGQDPCADMEAVGTTNPDGSMTCVIEEIDTLDNVIAMAKEAEHGAGPFTQDSGTTVERRGEDVFVSFDLSAMLEDMPPAEERAQMSMMFGDAFVGKAISINVIGQEILETNGTLSADGTTATFAIDLEAMFSPDLPDLPASFDVLLKTK